MTKEITVTMRSAKPFKFTDHHQEILIAVYTFHLLTSQQITRRLRPKTLGNLTTIQTYLRELIEQKYLIADTVPTDKGTRPYFYALALKGRRHLEALGYTITKHFEPGILARLTYLRDHTLELNDFLITAATLPAFDSRITMTDLQHDLILQEKPLEWVDGQGKLRILKPDALLQFHHPHNSDTAHYLIWIELDRGHHNPQKFQKQLADRWEFFSRGYHTKLLHRKRMTILYVTTQGDEHVALMRSQARKLFPQVGLKDAENQLFKFASVPPLMQTQPLPPTVFLEPYWLTGYGDKKQSIIHFPAED